MFKLEVRETPRKSGEQLYICICNLCLAILIATIVLFGQTVEYSIFEVNLSIPASVIAYVFLYPVIFIVFRVYGYKATNQLVLAVFIGSLFFFIFCFLITSIPTLNINNDVSGLKQILHQSLKMYLYGLIGMPAGIYAGVFTLMLYIKIFKEFNFLSIFTSTVIGEFVNSVIVFPTAYWDIASLNYIYNLLMNALVFKITAAFILCYPTAFLIRFINTKIKYKIL